MANSPAISVIIASSGRFPLLRHALRGLAAQTYQDAELIIAFDDCFPGEGWVPQAAKVTRGVWHSAAKARNAALRLATAPRVLVLDEDCFPCPDILARHAAVPGETAWIGRRRFLPAARTQALTDTTTWEQMLPHCTPDLREDHLRRCRHQPDKHKVFFTCHVSFPRAAALAIGGLWEAMPASGFEDVEFGLRLLRFGVRLDVPDEAVLPPVVHLHHPRCAGQTRHYDNNKKLYQKTVQDPSIIVRNR